MKDQIGRLARSTAIYGVGQVAGRLMSLLLLPVFTAYLSPAEYGLISILSLISFIATPLVTLGLGTALGVCYYQQPPGEARLRVVATTVGLLLLACAALMAVTATAGDTAARVLLERADRSDLIWLVCLTTCANILATPLLQVLQFEERSAEYVLVSVLSTAVTLGASVALVVGAGRGVHGWQEGALAGQLVMLFGAAWPVARRLPFRFDPARARLLLAVGIPMIPAFMATILVQHANKYFLQRSHGLEAVGVYSAGSNLGFTIALVVSSFQNSWLPFFMTFADRRDEAAGVLGRVATYYVLGVGALTLVFYGTAGLAVSVMTAPPYHEAYRVVGLAATSQFFAGTFLLFLPGLYFNREVPYQSLIQVVASVAALLFNAYLIPRFGVSGAAWALAAGSVGPTLLLILWNRFRRHAYVTIRLDNRRVALFAAVGIPLALSAAWPRELVLWRELAVAATVGASVLVLMTALLTAGERETVRGWTGRLATRRTGSRP